MRHLKPIVLALAFSTAWLPAYAAPMATTIDLSADASRPAANDLARATVLLRPRAALRANRQRRSMPYGWRKP